MNRTGFAVALPLILGIATPTSVLAWGHQGHEAVGNIAAILIKGTNAETQVKALLQPDETLAAAAEWPDCAKGFSYCHKEPTAEMKDFTQHNHSHHAYHYTDIPFQLTAYKQGEIGTNPDDVVSILQDAVLVLQGKTAANPSHKLTKREALFMVAHMTGDIHQPLHVGAAYMSPSGEFAVPQTEADAKAGFTQGGNLLCNGSRNVHSFWDDDLVLKAMRTAKVTTSEGLVQALLPKANTFTGDGGDVGSWPTLWANESLRLSQVELSPLTVVRKRAAGPDRSPCQPSVAGSKGQVWEVKLPDQYADKGAVTAGDQIAKAGARLANTLKAIWP